MPTPYFLAPLVITVLLLDHGCTSVPPATTVKLSPRLLNVEQATIVPRGQRLRLLAQILEVITVLLDHGNRENVPPVATVRPLLRLLNVVQATIVQRDQRLRFLVPLKAHIVDRALLKKVHVL